MKKLKLSVSVFALTAFFASTDLVWARDCELPHEWLQKECQASDSAVSAVQKSQNRDLKTIVADYREKSRAYSETIEKADQEYQAYRAQKRR